MITDVLRIPDARWLAAQAHLRRWRDDFGGLLEAERERWLIWVPVLLGLGVAAYFGLDREPKLSSGFLLFVLTGALGLGMRRRPAVARGLAALTIVAAGFLAAELRTAAVSAPVLMAPTGAVTVSGRVAEVELQEKSARIVLTDVGIGGLKPAETPAEIRIGLTRYSDIPKLGDRLTVRAKLFSPPSPAAPGAHDFRRDLFFPADRRGGLCSPEICASGRCAGR